MLDRTKMIAALLIIAVSACNKPPAPAVSRPPIADLNCPAEPDVVASLAEDPSGLLFDVAVRAAGQACRDALARVCRWHKERGATDVTCPQAIEP
jgi:hypothetical protein